MEEDYVTNLIKAGKFEQAILDLNKMIADDMDNTDLFLTIGIAFIENNQLEEGKKALDYYHSKEEPTAESYEAEAVYWIKKNDLEKSEDYLTRALSLDPNSGNINRNLSMLYRLKHQSSKAAFYLQRAIDLDPENYLTQIAFAQAMAEAGDFYSAVNILENILDSGIVIPEEKNDYVKELLGRLYGYKDEHEG